MESLYRTYRPLTFESVVGQQHIVSTLEHAIIEGRLSHAYLFCGPRGTGKTTMARIVAKALLCEHAEAARAEGASGCLPDGSCPECQLIAEGTHPDVYELDAASRTGVDNVREEIINSVSFAPVRGAYKIYIIDEVHMLTTQAFNALLKTLEEPPEHVLFVLCTTDPQKIPETILSRCQRFDFHRISNEDIVGRLTYICEQEGFDYDTEALEIVAKHARGGMRDALSTLEQLSVFGNGAVHVADARALLGEVSSTVLSEFSRAIAARDVVTLFGLVRAQVDEGEDLMELTRDLVAHVRDVYMVRVAGARAELFDGEDVDVAALAEEAELFETPDRLARVLTVLDDAALEMRTATDTRLVLEIALTRLARPESDLSLEALAERIDRLEARMASGVPAAPLDAREVAALTGAAASGGASVAGTVGAGTPSNAADGKAGTSDAAAGASGAGALGARAGAPGCAAGSATESAAKPLRHNPVEAASAPAQPARPASVVAPSPAAGAAPRPAAAQVNPAASAGPATAQVNPAVAPAGPATAPAQPSAAAVAASAAAPTPAVTDPGELQRKWTDVVKRVTAAQPSRGALLQSSRAQSDDGTTLTIWFPAGSGFAITMLGRPDTQTVVLPQVCAVFGNRAVHYVMGDAAPKPAANQPSSAASPAPASAVQTSGSAAASVTTPAPAAVPSTSATNPAASVPTSASTASTPAAAHLPASAIPTTAPTSTPATPDSVSAPLVQPAHTSGVSSAPVASQVSASVPTDTSAASQTAASTSTIMPSAFQVPAPVSTTTPPAQRSDSAATPAEPTPPVPATEHTAAPAIPEPESPASAWDDDQVPYDDMAAMPYDEEDLPPFDMPDVSETPAPVMPDASYTTAHATVTADVPNDTPDKEQPAQSDDDGDGDAGSPEDVASILGTVFGDGVKLTQIGSTE